MKKYKHTKNITVDGRVYKIRADTKEELAVKEYKKRQELENGIRKITRSILVRDWTEWKIINVLQSAQRHFRVIPT